MKYSADLSTHQHSPALPSQSSPTLNKRILLRRLPLIMILARHREPTLIIALLIEHMMPEIIQLRLIETRRQIRRSLVLDVLQTRPQSRYNMVPRNTLGDDSPQRRETLLELRGDSRLQERTDELRRVGRVDGFEEVVVDEVSLDDAAGAPDLQELGVVDVEVEVFVGFFDDQKTLAVGGEAGGVDGFAKVFEKGGAVGDVESARGEVDGVKGFLDLAAVV